MVAKPVTPEELKQKLVEMGVDLSGRFAVAVSGGADSIALALLMGQICDVEAVTVDHGLRSEATEEARFVGEVMARHTIAHTILQWQGEKPSSGIQAAARTARYKLIQDWCTVKNISNLVLAHHLDDQAETFLMRLSRGSGVYGLASMAEESALMGSLGNIRLLRPLLHVSKDRLISTLTSMGQEWVEDPSNSDIQYDRVKAREYLSGTPLLNLDSSKLAQTADRMQRAKQALDFYASELLSQAVAVHSAGYCEMDVKTLCAAPDETGLRALARLVRHISGATYSPRLDKLERAYEALGNPAFSGQTLFGCQFTVSNGSVILSRESSAVDEMPWCGHGLWDGRYDISQSGSGQVKKLGADGWEQIKAVDSTLKNSPIPYNARLSLPTLWHEDKVVAQPHLHFGEGLSVKFTPICAL